MLDLVPKIVRPRDDFVCECFPLLSLGLCEQKDAGDGPIYKKFNVISNVCAEFSCLTIEPSFINMLQTEGSHVNFLLSLFQCAMSGLFFI